MSAGAQILQRGDFVCVKPDSDFRPGQDGMVVARDDGEAVGLLFGFNRYGKLPHEVFTTGLTEEWLLSELDLTTISH